MASIESEKVNAGIDSASVIVLVIAFFIPEIRFTLRDRTKKAETAAGRGGLLTSLAQ